MKTAILNIKKITKENSIVLVNRTTDKKNIASFFIKKGGKFRLLENVNGGSEIKNLIAFMLVIFTKTIGLSYHN